MTAKQSRGIRDGTVSTDGQLSVLVVTSHRPEEIVTTVAEMESNVEVVTIDADVGPLRRSVTAAIRTRDAIRAHDPDVLLLDCFETIGAPATFVAFRSGVPVVARLVGNPWRKLKEERLEPARARGDVLEYTQHRVSYSLNEYVFSRADGFVVVSNELKDVVERRVDCPRDRIGVVPVPVTTDLRKRGSKAKAREKFDLDADRVVLTVTNLKFKAKLEGVKTIVTELRPLLQKEEDVAYLIAGGGRHYDDLLAWLETTIDDSNVRRRIHAPGYVNSVADLYAVADVFAYVSYLDGYPNAVLEAQTAGLPVVANDAHGMCDQITDGESGFLVDPEKPAALRPRVSYLLGNPSTRHAFGTRARARVDRENSPEIVGDRLEEFVAGFLSDDDPTVDNRST